jgi:hypothetical protein
VSAGERLVTVLTTLVVPAEADPDDAVALVALAAESTALQVVQSVGVEGHLPVPGATVLRGRQPRPWLVVSLGERGAVLRDLAGGMVAVAYRALAPDPVLAPEVGTR